MRRRVLAAAAALACLASVHGLGLGKRSELVRALSDPKAQLNAILLNEQARLGLFLTTTQEAGTEQALLEGAGILGAGNRSRAQAHAKAVAEENAALWWTSRLLRPSAWWNGAEAATEEEAESQGLFFASLPAAVTTGR